MQRYVIEHCYNQFWIIRGRAQVKSQTAFQKPYLDHQYKHVLPPNIFCIFSSKIVPGSQEAAEIVQRSPRFLPPGCLNILIYCITYFTQPQYIVKTLEIDIIVRY